MNSIRILLQSAIDYAGLFPPASLQMADAAREYAACREGGLAWTLGRFIVPVSRLAEFEDGAGNLLPNRGGGFAWHLSVLGGPDRDKDLGIITAFNRRHSADSDSGAAVIDTIESKARTVQEIRDAAGDSSGHLDSYFEIPLSEDLPGMIAAINRTGGRAKVRTGGLTPEQFPTVEELARFVSLCAQSGVAFKATAGLHHPFRAVRRLSYDPLSPSGRMHGFLNLMLASAYARGGMNVVTLEKLLEDGAQEAFRFADDGASWRAERLTISQLLDSRQHSMISFGSCSLQEPFDDLKALGLL